MIISFENIVLFCFFLSNLHDFLFLLYCYGWNLQSKGEKSENRQLCLAFVVLGFELRALCL
jgi:hypothetical protein